MNIVHLSLSMLLYVGRLKGTVEFPCGSSNSRIFYRTTWKNTFHFYTAYRPFVFDAHFKFMLDICLYDIPELFLFLYWLL